MSARLSLVGARQVSADVQGRLTTATGHVGLAAAGKASPHRYDLEVDQAGRRQVLTVQGGA